MLAPLLDHLTAVVVGTILIVTLLSLQMRERQTGIVDTINHTVRVQLNEAMEAVSDDVMNMRSPESAETATGMLGGTFKWSASLLASGETGTISFPSAVLQDPTTLLRAYGQVTYRLLPSGGSVGVQGVRKPLYTLVREVDYSVTGSAQPADLDTLSRSLTSFRMGFVSGVIADSTRWASAGTDLELTHSIQLSAAAARPAPDQLDQKQAYMGSENEVSYATVLAPQHIR